MGRPLTGSIRRDGSSWVASVPAKRGGSKRVEKRFATEHEGQTWLDLAVEILNAGSTVSSDLHVEGWFESVPREIITNHYLISQCGLPDTGDAALRILELHLIPYFAARWKMPADVNFESVLYFSQFISGRRLADDTLVVGTERVREAYAFSVKTQGNVLGVLKLILKVLVARGDIARYPAEGIKATKPPKGAKRYRKERANKRTTMTLARCKFEIAPNLHIVYQLAMWIQRLCGLRIREAWGIRVGDIQRAEGFGWVDLDSQGGREFSDFDELGGVVTGDRTKHRLKTTSSYRRVMFPRCLMPLVDAVIAAYHTNEFGEIDETAPLLFGAKEMGRGQAGYRSALKVAGLDVEDFTSHDFRKWMFWDLAQKVSEISEVMRRILAGHRAGSDEHGTVYLAQTVGLSTMLEAVSHVDRLVANEVGSILVPTNRSPLFARKHPYYARQARANEVLAERGFLLVQLDLLGTAEIGERIGRSEQVVRRHCTEGLIDAVRHRGVDGLARWHATPEAVEAFIARYDGWETIDGAGDELGLSYHQVYERVQRLGLESTLDDITGRLLIRTSAVDALRCEIERVRVLRERSMLISEAATVLGKKRSTLQGWIKRGDLVLDDETDTVGQMYVTRDSVSCVAGSVVTTTRNRGIPR